MTPPTIRAIGVTAILMWLGQPAAPVCAQAQVELEEVVAFEQAARAMEEAQRPEAARRQFAGRGTAIAELFLTRTDVPPSNDTYFTIFLGLAETDAVLRLIDGMVPPPGAAAEGSPPYRRQPAAGAPGGGMVAMPPRLSGILDRSRSETSVAVEASLTHPPARDDARIVEALLAAITSARASADPWDDQEVPALAIRLLGISRHPSGYDALLHLWHDADPSMRKEAVEAFAGYSMWDRERWEQDTIPSEVRLRQIKALAELLAQEREPSVRAAAAQALSQTDRPEAAEALRQHVARETAASALDQAVMGLQRLDAPLDDPAQCYALAKTSAELGAAQQLFACWRATASTDQIVHEALHGPPAFRIAAMQFLVTSPDGGLLRLGSEPIVIPPPPVPGAMGRSARPMHMIQPPPPRLAPLATLSHDTREQLLASVVEVLSRGAALDGIVAHAGHELLWELAEHRMPVAIHHADKIQGTHARYAASQSLDWKDRRAYAAYRRPRQIALAVALALPWLALMMLTRFRRVATPMLLGALGWVAWLLVFGGGVRELPPLPLPLLTVSAISWLSAGLVTGLIWALPPTRAGHDHPVIRTCAAAILSSAVACCVAIWSRGSRIFPIGGEGWELLFDPLGAIIIGGVAGLAISTMTKIMVVSERIRHTS